MGLFSSIAGVGLNLLGSKLSQRSQQRGADAAMQAAQPLGVSGPFGRSSVSDGRLTVRPRRFIDRDMRTAFARGRGALGELGRLDFEGREQEELERLGALRAPLFADARAGLESRLFNSGRLGAARGGGLTGALFNPETAGLEEAIARTQLGDIAAARNMSLQEQAFLADQAASLFNTGANIGRLPLNQAALGIQARAPAGIAAMQAGPGMSQARTYEGFFSTLGSQLGGLFGGGGTFSGGGGRPPLGYTHGQGL